MLPFVSMFNCLLCCCRYNIFVVYHEYFFQIIAHVCVSCAVSRKFSTYSEINESPIYIFSSCLLNISYCAYLYSSHLNCIYMCIVFVFKMVDKSIGAFKLFCYTIMTLTWTCIHQLIILLFIENAQENYDLRQIKSFINIGQTSIMVSDKQIKQIRDTWVTRYRLQIRCCLWWRHTL